MVAIDSTRRLHSELAIVCASLEALFGFCQDSDFEAAALPALVRFRDLLDVGDAIVGPEDTA